MSPPLVSVVIPCFNAGSMVERCLASCLAQSYPRLEVVVVDNNSTDDSLERVERVAAAQGDRVRITRCALQGSGHARNAGIALARGDYLQFLDADDELEPDKIRPQVEALESRPDLDGVYGDWLWSLHLGSGQVVGARFHSAPVGDYLAQLLVDNWRPPHCYLTRRAALDAAPTLPEFYTAVVGSDDREYFTRAVVLGLRFEHVPRTWVRYNTWSASQVTLRVRPATRARSLERAFARMRRLAARPGSPVSSAMHWRLLEQDRGLWSAVRDGGASRPAGPRGRVLDVLRTVGEVNTLEHHARVVAKRFCLEAAARLLARGTQATIETVRAAMLHGLGGPARHRREQPGAGPVPDPRIEPVDTTLGRWLRLGPLYIPQFAEERLRILEHLEALRETGWLVRAGAEEAPDPPPSG